MNCPTCSVELRITDRQGIEIDYCPKCRGVWLDRGELDKIIERAALETRPPEPEYDDRRDSYGKPYYKKRKSFFGDLFDFD